EQVVLIQHVGETARHAGAEVVAGIAEHSDAAASHVFTAVITRAFHHGVRTGVTHPETLTGGTGREQPAAGGAIQAGVADDGGFLALERAAFRRTDHQLAAGHALADVVVGIAFDVHVQAAGIEHTEALAGGADKTHLDRRLFHAEVAVTAGDFTGQPRAERAVAVGDAVVERTAAGVLNRRQHVLHHLLGQFALVERLVAFYLTELRLVGRHVIAAQDRHQVQLFLP